MTSLRIKTLTASAVLLCGLLANAQAHRATLAPRIYDVDEAYRVYDVLLAREKWATHPAAIQAETSFIRIGTCLTKEAAAKFKDAIDDFARVNKQTWILNRRFNFQKPYQIVSRDTVKSQQYAGIVELSAVGFSTDKTQAVAEVFSIGTHRFYLLEKVNGTWQLAPGVICSVVF